MTSNLNRSLRKQFDNTGGDYFPAYGQFRTYLFRPEAMYPYGRIYQQILTYDPEENLGVAEYLQTKMRTAFRVWGEATPRACRNYRPEQKIELYDIQTVADDGAIYPALGERAPAHLGRWMVCCDIELCGL